MTNYYENDLTRDDTTSAFVYADSAIRHEIQLPLALSWHTQSGVMAEDLYNDDDARYVTYASGVNETIISSRTKDRFGSMSVELVEGEFSGFIQVFDESIWDSNPPAVAGPYTTSGDASGDTLYLASYYEDTPNDPQYITFSGAGSYNVIFPKPVISRSFKLIHSGSAPYKISRIIPRRAIQSFDLEVNAIKAYHVSASLIETIALEVSDSIVVGPDLIGDKTIDGRKIIDGTVSGVLITPGTVTGNLIQAGTISGVLITGGTITGDKITAATISGALITAGTITGEKIAATTISGSLIAAGAITADKINVTNLSAVNASTGNLSVNGTLTVTSGQILAGKAVISSTGIDIVSSGVVSRPDSLRIMGSAATGSIEGIGFYNTTYSTATPMAVLSTNWNNVFGISMPYDLSPGGYSIFQIGFNDSSGGQVRILSGGLDIVKGALYIYDSLGTSVTSTVNNAGQAEFSSNVQTQSFLSTRNGSSSSPAFSWLSDPDTGFYRYSDGAIAITSNTVVSAAFFEGRALFEDGLESAPGIAFRLGSGTGIYRPGTNAIGITAGGVEALRVVGNGVVSINNTNQNGQLTVEIPNGTARNVMSLRQLNDASAYINFVSNTVTTSTPIQTSALGTYAGKIRILINGTTRWIPFYL